ncbi:DUF6508 domain-containing protein [Methylobacterium sp. WL6]|uniref:DUF6508 domain-containing protein n=1 Tax=Methylobacterium sp. WL6 TaxID=2603901 RepID=UPI0011C7A7A4|nr:DUF6508 domain-containing protein [Methylobacterium sp. WL6]TXN73694.1 hypothetical protein FV230_00200 [Methylobacterium sp. WL6]
MKETLERRRARLVALAQHIPAFADPAAPAGEWYHPDAEPGTFSAPSFLPNAEAERFVADCYAYDWVLSGFDWAAWAQTAEAQRLRNDPSQLAGANEHQLAQLLTVFIRQDRFVEGALATAFESGLILGILQRTKQLTKRKDKPAAR